MADASWGALVSLPAGFGVPTPGVFAVDLGPSIVRRILLTWPAGCGGLVFLQVQAGGGFAYPSQPGQFLAFDDYTYAFDVSNQINNGNWSILCSNHDAIGHDPAVIFEYDYLRGSVATAQSNPIAL